MNGSPLSFSIVSCSFSSLEHNDIWYSLYLVSLPAVATLIASNILAISISMSQKRFLFYFFEMTSNPFKTFYFYPTWLGFPSAT
jgi:hypothetical protein